MSKEQKNVALYMRYSSNNQREESIEAQHRICEDFCNKNGYKIVEIYIDKAISGTSDKRPQFQKMIKDSELDKFSLIICHKLDRFSRNKYDSALYKKKLKNNGVRVVSVTENLDDTPESVILESVIEGMAEYYSRNLAREVMKGLNENAYKCKHNGGYPPLGYNVKEDKTYIINESEAEAVELIFNMFLNDYTSGQMIAKLNSLGYKTKKGSLWTKNSLTSIVRNEKYTGTYIYNRCTSKDSNGHRNNHKNKSDDKIIRIEGGMPQIIDKELFEKVQEKLKHRKKTVQSSTKTTYLLSGLIKCSCGSSMHGNIRRAKRKTLNGVISKPEYISYRCGCRKNKSSIVCKNPEIRKEYLEDFVLYELEKNILEKETLSALLNNLNENLTKEREKINLNKTKYLKELKEIDKKHQNIINAIMNGMDQTYFKDALEKLSEEKDVINKKIALLSSTSYSEDISLSSLENHLKNLKTFILERNYPEIKTFIKNFVKEIIVSNEGVEVIFTPFFNFSKNFTEIQISRCKKRLDLYTPLKRCFTPNHYNNFFVQEVL